MRCSGNRCLRAPFLSRCCQMRPPFIGPAVTWIDILSSSSLILTDTSSNHREHAEQVDFFIRGISRRALLWERWANNVASRLMRSGGVGRSAHWLSTATSVLVVLPGRSTSVPKRQSSSHCPLHQWPHIRTPTISCFGSVGGPPRYPHPTRTPPRRIPQPQAL